MNTSRKLLLMAVLSVVLVGIACASSTGTGEAPTIVPTPALLQTTSIPTTAPPVVGSVPTSAPTQAAVTQAPSDEQADVYLDDLTGPDTLMRSFVNALNRHEYVRAYSYWETDAEKPSYDQFEQGYAETDTVVLTMGTIRGGVAAGNQYFTVPVTLVATTTAGAVQTFVGCYQLHIGSPAAQGALPFAPMGIQKADVQEVANGTNTADAMAHACDSFPGADAGIYQPPSFAAADISANRYLDDRSDPVQVLRSYFNALNLHEYVRAYSYWGPDAISQTLDQFQTGYENTHDIELITGEVASDAGAGQLYYSLPITLHAMSGDEPQTFVGCYTFHLSQPSFQGVPPYQGLTIRSADAQQVANDADTVTLMATACPVR